MGTRNRRGKSTPRHGKQRRRRADAPARRSEPLTYTLTLHRRAADDWYIQLFDPTPVGVGWRRVCALRVLVDAGDRGEFALHPDDVARLPPEVIAADPRRQNFCLGGPHLVYAPQKRRCRRCRRCFVFSPEEQRHWYETLGFWVESVPVACAPCRTQIRGERALSREHAACVLAARQHPQDAAARLAVARSTLKLRETAGRGDLNRGIAAARRAYRLDPRAAADALFVEGRLQDAAGRRARALDAFRRFVDARAGSRALRREARRILEAHAGLPEDE